MVKISPQDKPLLVQYWRDIWTLQMELNHHCPNCDKHTKCPTKQLRDEFSGYLPAQVVFDLCASLKESGNYWATIMFHLYNEPTSDCRLAWIVDTIRHKMGMKNQIKIHSSTVNVDRVLIEDLIACGVNHITFTCPTKQDEIRFNEHREYFMKHYPDVRFRIYVARYDNRLNIYKGEPIDMGRMSDYAEKKGAA